MSDAKPSKKDLEKLAQQISSDQTHSNPAEKRIKLNVPFKKAIRRMGRTPPPNKNRN